MYHVNVVRYILNYYYIMCDIYVILYFSYYYFSLFIYIYKYLDKFINLQQIHKNDYHTLIQFGKLNIIIILLCSCT